ncbi:MAG: ABC transporter ATP-binding protein, partial [Arenimonas sp.]
TRKLLSKIPGVQARPQQRAREALTMGALGDMAARRPSQLSGGQRQRVALARALVNRPKVLLLDEPLGALDLKLREQMQDELKSLQKKLGITFIYVTHDQGEALSMSDRVAVFNNGRIEQVDSPEGLYRRPATLFVANFVGTSNIFDADAAQRLFGRHGAFSVRPENIRVNQPVTDGIAVTGLVRNVQFHGSTSRVEIRTEAGIELAAVLSNSLFADAELPAPGAQVTLAWPAEAMVPLAS